MRAWDLRRLQQYLEKYPPANLYLLFGDEMYLVDQALTAIKSKALSQESLDFNFDQFFVSDESTIIEVKDSVETLPVMTEQRLVILREGHLLKEKQWDVLWPLLKDPLASCVFIIVADKIDQRKKVVKKIFEKGTVVELKKPYDNQVPQWIEYMSYQHEVKLDSDSIHLLQQVVGSSLSELNNEILKLKQYLGDKSHASREDVLKIVSCAKMDSVFELTNAIGRCDRAEALSNLANLLSQGQSEIAALALILRHVRILAQVREGIKNGLRGQQLAAQSGISAFFLKQYMSQCREWDEGKIVHTIEALHETDKALKTSPVSSHIWLENFIIQTCCPV